jgi:lysophospholipase L1-like esterase
VVFLGAKDCKGLDDEFHITAISLEEYKRNMEYLTASLIRGGKKLILVTIPDVDNVRLKTYLPANNLCYNQKRIDQTNEFLRDLARRKEIELVDFSAEIRAQREDVLEKDGLHLNSKGQTILCELLLRILP